MCALPGHATHLPACLQDRGGAASVPAYLRLPAEAYARLERDMIVPLSGSKFLLKLPRISVSVGGRKGGGWDLWRMKGAHQGTGETAA